MKKLMMLPVVLLAVALVGCSGSTVSHSNTYQIRYEVTGDVEQVTMIQYVDVDSGGLVTIQDVNLPWSIETTAGEHRIALSAYASTGENIGWLRATIYRNGVIWETEMDMGSLHESLSVLASGDLRD